jgi:myosin-7
LTAALAGTDNAAIKAALDSCKAKGMSNNNTVEQATIRVERGGAIDSTLSSLKKAQAEGDIATLEAGITKMVELGYDDDTVKSAKSARDDLYRLDVFKKDLKAAITTLSTKRENRGGISAADVQPISEAIAKAGENGLPEADPIFVEANSLNEQAKQQLVVQTQLSEALKTKKYTDLTKAVDAAEDLVLSLDDLEQAKTILMETAPEYPTEAGDVDEMADQQKELFQKATQKKYSFQQYSNIRSAEEFAKNVYLNKAKVKAEMLQWQNRLLTKSLLSHQKDYNKTAIRIHKSILGYMGDKTMSFPAALAEDILQKGLDLPDIVDEIYLQILKQLTKNPRAESIARGWQLMCMCVGTFPPSHNFQLYLLNFILLKAEIHGAVGNYARYSLRRLEGMLTSGPSGFVPSVEEIQAYKERPPILSTIELVDGTPLTEDLPITPDLNVEKVLEICTHFLELKDPRSKDFGIFVVDTDEGSAPTGNTISQSAQELKLTPRPLRSEDYMGDVVVQKARQNRNHKFVFKRKIFLKNKDAVSDDEMFNRLIYLQAADEVISGNIPIEDETKLIALTTSCLVADLGEECPTNQEEMLENECIEWVPPQWKETKTPEDWADKFLEGRDAAMEKSGEELQADYVEEIRQHELYGTHFFHVKKVNNPLAVKDLPDKVVAAFNSDGLHFLDENRKILLSYGYADIYRWGGSSVQFSLIIWNADTQDTFELILTTYQAAHMAALILDFINAIMESTKA